MSVSLYSRRTLGRAVAVIALLVSFFQFTQTSFAYPIMPKISTSTSEYWYYIQFTRYNVNSNRYPLLGYDGTAAEGTTLRSCAIAQNQNYQWKLVETGTTGQYYLVNRTSGLYIKYDNQTAGAWITLTTEANAKPITLVDYSLNINEGTVAPSDDNSGNRRYFTSWCITSPDGTQGFNPNGGSVAGNNITWWNAGDGGNYVDFIPVETEYYPMEFYYSEEGSVLHDAGAGNAVNGVPYTVMQTATSKDDYLWGLDFQFNERQFKLKSKSGNYLAQSNSGFTTVSDATSATNVLLYAANPKADTLKVYNIVLLSNTTTALTLVDEEEGTIGTGEADAALSELVLYTINPQSKVEAFNLQFVGSGLYVLYDDKQNQCLKVLKSAAVTNTTSAQWYWVRQSTTGKRVLRSGNGKYLKWDGTSVTITSEESEATPLKRILNNYSSISGGTRYDFVLASDNTKALTYKNGELTFSTNNTRYSSVRPTTNLSNVTGAEAPQLSTEGNEVWYNMQFAQYNSTIYVSNENATGHLANLGNTSDPNYLWAFYPSGETGEVKIKNMKGGYLYQNGNYQQITTDASKAATYYLLETADNSTNVSLHTTWQVKNKSTGKYILPYTANTNVGYGSAIQVASRMTFSKGNTGGQYFIYSAMGSEALSDNNGGRPYVAQVIKDGDTSGFLWTVNYAGDNKFTLVSNHGWYLTYSAEADTFGTSQVAEDAYLFQRSTNSYENNGHIRYNYLSTDGTKALCMDNIDTGELYWGRSGTRYSLSYRNAVLNAPRLPKYVSATDGVKLYRIRTDEGNHYDYTDQGTGTALQIAATTSGTNVKQLWFFSPKEETDASAGDTYTQGDCYIGNSLSHYLKYDTTNGYLTTTGSRDDATVFRPIETNSHYNSWQLQVIDSSITGTSNILQYNSSNQLVLGACNQTASYVRIIEEDVYPSFYTEEQGAWRYLRFIEEDGHPVIRVDDDGNVNTTETILARDGMVWKNIGSENDFVLKSGVGKYMHITDDGSVELTEDSTAATHFYLNMTESKSDTLITFNICPLNEDGTMSNPPTKCLVRNSDGSLSMADYASHANTADAIVSFSDDVTPTFAEEDNDIYYYINFKNYGSGNLYLSDGVEDVYDAVPATKQLINSQLWTIVGSKDQFRVLSKDGEYLQWNGNGDNTFSVTKDVADAAIFKLGARGETISYLQLVDGRDGSSEYVGQYVTTNGTDVILSSTLQELCYLTLTEVEYPNAEDYTAFSIHPKRSWFVYQAYQSSKEPMNGFIKGDGEYGWTTNPYTGKLMQATNTYSITHYVKAGTTRTFKFPTIQAGSTDTRLRYYQRWYNYETDERLGDRVYFVEPFSQGNKTGGSVVSSRRDYANGTVMGRDLHLNDEYGDYMGNGFIFQMPERTTKDYRYTVGVDMSVYSDFVDYFGDNGNVAYSGAIYNEVSVPTDQGLIEPTLALRNLYIIRDARQMADSLNACTYGSDKWVEEHTIHFPKKKTNYANPTVPFNLQLQDYWYYTGGVASQENLTQITSYNQIYFVIEDNTAGIGGFSVTEWPVEGASYSSSNLSEKRFFRFFYPAESGTGYAAATAVGMAKGDKAVIKVYARDNGTAGVVGGTLYQLAKFNLMFDDDSELLLHSEVIGKNDNGEYKTHRAPDYMRRRYGTAKASIDFDDINYTNYVAPPYGKTFNGKNLTTVSPKTEYAQTYAYPLLYENSSYNFMFSGEYAENQWGSYTIAKQVHWSWGTGNIFKPLRYYYKEAYPNDDLDDSYSALMYVDASEEPGSIAKLDYTGTLCQGSRIYCSGWVTSPAASGTGSQPGNIILSVQGVTASGETDVLYTYSPGPFFANVRDSLGNSIKPSSGEVGNWSQFYFSFVNHSSKDYEKFQLNVDNNCTSSSGGDILLDDVEIYAESPEMVLSNSTPVCGQSVTLTKISGNYDVLLSTLGLEEGVTPSEGNPRLWYCLLDKAVYDNELANIYEPTTADIKHAFDTALVGDAASSTAANKAFRSIEFSTTYTDLPEFTYTESLETNEAIARRETTSDDVRHLIITDKVAGDNLIANHDYYLVFVPRYGNNPITAAEAYEQFQMGTECCIRSEFRTASSISVIEDADDGIANDDTLYVCAGKTLTIGANLNATDKTTGQIIQISARYDWWLDYLGGTFENAYITADGELQIVGDDEQTPKGAVSVSEALINFRHFYPDAIAFDGIEAHPDDENFPLTQTMIDALRTFSQPTNDRIPLLYLNLTTLNVKIAQPDTDADLSKLQNTITLIPIPVQDRDDVLYCFDAQHVKVRIQGKAPSMVDGFSGTTIEYPELLTNVPLRTDLAFVKSVSFAPGTTPTQVLRIPLRQVNPVNEAALGLKMIIEGGETYAPVYLSSTNDASADVYEEAAGSDVYTFKTIGRVEAISADKESTDAYMDIYFDSSKFQPREGYTYTLRMEFEENFGDADAPSDAASTCPGALVVDMKIVPKYAIWTGEAGNNDWTNDENWRRASRDELHFTDTTEADYVDNDANGTSVAFVPLRTTNAIIAQQTTRPELYEVEGGGTTTANFDRTTDGQSARTATEQIEYDMQISTNNVGTNKDNYPYIGCERYNPYKCDGIVVQSGGEIVHPERLTYSNAWMEYDLACDRWFTLASPIKKVYAGDWYAPTDGGRQNTPYFSPITFDLTSYDRYSPAVYQRSWDKGQALAYKTDGNAVDVYIKADWSSVYNDASVDYTEGGFSVKPFSVGKNCTYGNMLFRLPKDDTQYTYYKMDQSTAAAKDAVVDRGTEGKRFFADDLATANSFTQTLTNAQSGNLYYLAANPFPCGLDMQKFFEANTHIEPKYWLLTAEGQKAVMKIESNWITVPDASGNGSVVAAGQGFFIAVPSTHSGQSVTLTYTADMMTSASAKSVVLRAPRRNRTTQVGNGSLRMLRIRAEQGNKSSEAVVMKNAQAANEFKAAEDMQTLVDENLAGTPMVYTIAGTQAATVNNRRSMFRVPLGVVGGENKEVKLTFTGMGSFDETLSLLDEETGEIIPLTLSATAASDSVTIEVPGNTAGRYYILSSEQPSIEDNQTDFAPIVQSTAEGVAVTSPLAHPLTYVHIVDAGGRTVYTMRPYLSSLKLRLPQGAYVVEAETETDNTTCKLVVR